MAEEVVVETPEEPVVETPEVSNETEKDITTMLLDIQGLLTNMQQAMDRLAPVTEEPSVEEPPEAEEVAPETPSEDEVKEIDSMLQED